jgi:hypothetical protein
MSDPRPLWVEFGPSTWRDEYARAARRAMLGHHEMLPNRRFYTDAMLRQHIRRVFSTRGSRARCGGECEVLRWLGGGVFSDRSWFDIWQGEATRIARDQWDVLIAARADVATVLGRLIQRRTNDPTSPDP